MPILQYIPPMSVASMSGLMDASSESNIGIQHIIKPGMISAFARTPAGGIQQKVSKGVWYALIVHNLPSESPKIIQVYTLRNMEVLENLLRYVILLGDETLEREIRTELQQDSGEIGNLLHDIIGNTCMVDLEER
ncbi:MAG: hypothetical protein PHY14_01910 [Candidatus Gracilibacteria bacterium]|nr:hypothetical protein [Candidatus Gracilibacteria bacterium]